MIKLAYSLNGLYLMQMLLLKRGGRIIYNGPLGHNSDKLIEYFEVSRRLDHIFLSNYSQHSFIYAYFRFLFFLFFLKVYFLVMN